MHWGGRLALVAGCALCACQPAPVEPEAAPVPTETAARDQWHLLPAPEGDAAASPYDLDLPYGHSYAESPEQFHAVHVEALRHSALPTDVVFLQAYADALMWAGIGWELRAGDWDFATWSEEHGWRLDVGRGDPHTQPAGRLQPAAPFEAALLERVRVDRAPAWRTYEQRFYLAGPVVRTPACVACHNAPTEEMVGAYLYRFTEIPDD